MSCDLGHGLHSRSFFQVPDDTIIAWGLSPCNVLTVTTSSDWPSGRLQCSSTTENRNEPQRFYTFSHWPEWEYRQFHSLRVNQATISVPTPIGWRNADTASAFIGLPRLFHDTAHRCHFRGAVDAFKREGVHGACVHAGADYLLFTAAHALQMLPAPNPVIDRILPGRTCKRDLIAELADGLAAKGIPLLVYYNHSCNWPGPTLGTGGRLP